MLDFELVHVDDPFPLERRILDAGELRQEAVVLILAERKRQINKQQKLLILFI